jgi:pimeloyl-ACP methyl ester carboxylesterase
MKQILTLLSFVLVLAIVSVAGLRQASTAKPTIQLQPCDVPGIKEKAKCGELEVFENRATRQGRKIKIKVVVVPSTATSPSPDPLFYIPGGPGSSSVEDAPGVASQFSTIRQHRDLVFVDQRGTGASNPLNCTFFDPKDTQSYFGYFFPLNDVRKCREELEKLADLTLYTTPIAMDDLEDVRQALGYDRINIFGGSYGTRASLVYLRQHGDHVRTTILQGVVPTDDYMPFDYARRNERALDGVIAECAADEACHKTFPNLSDEKKSVLGRLLQGSVEVEVKLGNAGDRTAKVKLSRDLAAEAIRYMLYSPVGASRVPSFIHQAATGNFVPLAQAALSFREGIVSSGSNGMYLSVTCAEDLPWIKANDATRLAEGTFLGDYRFRQQREACALWRSAKVPADYAKPVRSAAPVLILTGEWDPVTPPSNGDAAARYLPNSKHIIVPHGGHGFGGLDGLGCVQELLDRFLETANAKDLEASCVGGIKRRGFVLK